MENKEMIIDKLNVIGEKLDNIQETSLFQANKDYMYKIGTIMGDLDNLIDDIEFGDEIGINIK